MQKSRVVTWLAPLILVAWSPLVKADENAETIAHRLQVAMGGREAFVSRPYLEFNFSVLRDGGVLTERDHAWDRSTGRYRIDTTTQDGERLRVHFRLDTRAGQAWLDGRSLPPEEAAPFVESGYRMFINDTYWLLMPWKWLDPGVRLDFTGSKQESGHEYDVVQLSFADEVGLTSNDVYWGWVSKESGLMERWEFQLQDKEGNPGSAEPSVWEWRDWQDAGGGVLVARIKSRVGAPAGNGIEHRHVRLLEAAPPEAFTAP